MFLHTIIKSPIWVIDLHLIIHFVYKNHFKYLDCNNSLDNTDAHFPLTQVCLPQLINSTTNSIGLHSSSLCSAFLARVQQGRALERAFVALNSMGMHCHAYRKYTEASKIWTPLNPTQCIHSSSRLNGMYIRSERIQVREARLDRQSVQGEESVEFSGSVGVKLDSEESIVSACTEH